LDTLIITMAIYTVNPDTVPASGLRLRSAPSTSPDTLLGVLARGDFVEASGPALVAPPVEWLPERVLSSPNFPAGTAGFAALRLGADIYLTETSATPPPPPADPPANALSLGPAIARAAKALGLPALLLKAHICVEGANPNHRDGVLQVIPSTREGVIRRLPRALKLDALAAPADDARDEAALNADFGAAFQRRNLYAQVLCGGCYIQEQLARFGGYVALAGLAYNAGAGAARSVIEQRYGGDAHYAALQYHRRVGPGPDDASVGAPETRTDLATGVRYSYFPVRANDTGVDIFQYLYLRQVPGRNYGVLDFIFRPALTAAFGLLASETAPSDDTSARALVVTAGEFGFIVG
jgi:hypothetical protein